MTPIQPPMTDERLDRLVRQLLTERADDVAAVAMPAQTMTAVVASHVRRGGIAERRALLLVAAGLLIVLAAGAVAVGSGLIRRGPEPQPAPQPVVVPPLDETSPAPSDAAMEPEHVFYTVFEELQVGDEGCTEANASRFGSCTSSRIWVADPDGSNARELFPESTDHRSILDVSAAGDAMVFTAPVEVDGQPVSGTHLAELGPAGDVLATSVISNEVLDDGCDWPVRLRLRVRVLAGRNAPRVRACQPPGRGGLRHGDRHPGRRDRRGHRSSTRRARAARTAPTERQSGLRTAGNSCSPASRLASRPPTTGSRAPRPSWSMPTAAIFGNSPTPRCLRRDGAWSPDGSTIAFTSAIAWLGVDQFGKRENFNEDSDVYTVRADGSDVRRLTNFAPTRVDRGVPVQVGGPCRRLDPRRADRLHRAPMGRRRGRFDKSAARGLDHGRRWCERAADRWLGCGEPDGGGVRRLPVPARCVGHGVQAFWRPAP